MEPNFQRLKGVHTGEPIFVCGCGPSIDSQELNLLDGFISIAVNKFPERYDKSPYWLGLDSGMCEYILRRGLFPKKPGDKVESVPFHGLKFLWDHYSKKLHSATLIRRETNHLWFPRNRSIAIDSVDPIKGLSFANSSAYAAVHLAMIMGASTIILIGNDFSWKPQGMFHFSRYSTLPTETFRSKRGESVTTKAGDRLLTTKIMRKMVQYFDSIPAIAANHGIELINATDGGILESWPRASLRDVVARFSAARNNQSALVNDHGVLRRIREVQHAQ